VTERELYWDYPDWQRLRNVETIVAYALLRAVFALLRTRFCSGLGVHRSV